MPRGKDAVNGDPVRTVKFNPDVRASCVLRGTFFGHNIERANLAGRAAGFTRPGCITTREGTIFRLPVRPGASGEVERPVAWGRRVRYFHRSLCAAVLSGGTGGNSAQRNQLHETGTQTGNHRCVTKDTHCRLTRVVCYSI